MLDLSAVLDGAGVPNTDRTVPGYRGKPFDPVGMIWHHTATPRGYQMRSEPFTAGRPGLPGPVVHFGISRTAEIMVFTDGLANHCGKASKQAVDEIAAGNASDVTARARGLKDDMSAGGNRRLFGIEIDLDGVGEPISGPQLDAAFAVTAAVFAASGWTAGHLSDHQRVTARKVDLFAPNLPSWPQIRARLNGMLQPASQPVGAVLATGANQAEGFSGRLPVWKAYADGRVECVNGADFRGDLVSLGVTPAHPVTHIFADGAGYVLYSAGDDGTFLFA